MWLKLIPKRETGCKIENEDTKQSDSAITIPKSVCKNDVNLTPSLQREKASSHFDLGLKTIEEDGFNKYPYCSRN